MDPKSMAEVNEFNDMSEKPVIHANKSDGDAILASLEEAGMMEALSPEDDRRILRKIDFW